MPIDPFAEETLSFSQTARRLPHLRNGRPVHVSTLWRWATRGLRGVRLETMMLGGSRVTSAEALCRFFAALSDPIPTPLSRPDGSHDAAIERELNELGI